MQNKSKNLLLLASALILQDKPFAFHIERHIDKNREGVPESMKGTKVIEDGTLPIAEAMEHTRKYAEELNGLPGFVCCTLYVKSPEADTTRFDYFISYTHYGRFNPEKEAHESIEVRPDRIKLLTDEEEAQAEAIVQAMKEKESEDLGFIGDIDDTEEDGRVIFQRQEEEALRAEDNAALWSTEENIARSQQGRIPCKGLPRR